MRLSRKKSKPETKPEAALSRIADTDLIREEDLKALFNGLDPEVQEQITKDVLDKMGDETLNLSKDKFMVERMLSLTMIEWLKKAAFGRIKDGNVDGGKSGDAINKFFLKLIEAEEKLKKAAVPKVTTNVNIEVDKDTVRELFIARGKKAVDAEFKEVEQ